MIIPVDTAIHWINLLIPKHDRTSCSDTDWEANAYANEQGYPRCSRCALLYKIHTGKFPYDAQASCDIIFEVRYDRDHNGIINDPNN